MPTTPAKRTHVVIPADLVHAIDSLVGKRGRSAFITDAATVASFLVDTSILIDFLNDKAGRKQLLLDLVRQEHMLASCPVTLAEIYSGMHPKDAPGTKALLSSLRFYNITPEVSYHAGRLRYANTRHLLCPIFCSTRTPNPNPVHNLSQNIFLIPSITYTPHPQFPAIPPVTLEPGKLPTTRKEKHTHDVRRQSRSQPAQRRPFHRPQVGRRQSHFLPQRQQTRPHQ